MAKKYLLEVRVTFAERLAVRRLAKAERVNVSELVRVRVVAPAVGFDPRQMELPTRKEERPRRAG